MSIIKSFIKILFKNKKQYSIGFLICIIVVFGIVYKTKSSAGPLIVGIHDPEGIFANEKRITMTSDYFAWNKDIKVVTDELQKATLQQRAFLLTIEPWPKPVGFQYATNNELLKAVIAGEYNQIAANICSELSTAQVPVYIRWGHEMELENSRYPWSHADPELYIQAYKHFVDICRNKGRYFKFVWSPAGESGLERYWPGKEYVDVIGVSIYSFDQYDEKHIGHKRSFKEVFLPRYERVKKYNKPVLIAEMGTTGSDEYKLEWIGWMVKDLYQYRKLIGVIYLNTLDPQAVWESGLDNPDWRLPTRVIKLLFPEK